jgi:hypothetical protein
MEPASPEGAAQMSEQDKYLAWRDTECPNGATFWECWQAARAPLLEELAVQDQVRNVMHQDMTKLELENERLRAQVEGLENKCALLAASWKKAEDRVAELEKTIRGFAESKVSR